MYFIKRVQIPRSRSRILEGCLVLWDICLVWAFRNLVHAGVIPCKLLNLQRKSFKVGRDSERERRVSVYRTKFVEFVAICLEISKSGPLI